MAPSRTVFHAASALLCFVAILYPSAACADFSVKFEIKDGAKISDTITIVAKVTATDDVAIQKVEFMVDDQLRHTDPSTPYTYDWDTLEDMEGPHTLNATVFDAKGQSRRAKIKVTIDNELDKGADFHADKALEAIKSGNAEDASRYSRRALKIDPKNGRAGRVRAGLLAQNRDYTAAAEVLEQAEFPANEIDGRMELIYYYLAAGDSGDSSENLVKSAGKAIDVYKKVVAARLAAAGADPQKKGEAEFAARNYAGAVTTWQKPAQGDAAPIEAINRLVLGYIAAGRTREARSVINSLEINKRADAVTRSLKALMLLKEHQPEKAREMLQDGVENDVLPSLIVASYADLLLRQKRRAADEAERAYKIAPDLADTRLLASYANPDPIAASKAAMAALAVDPTLSEAYAQRGYQVLSGKGAKRIAAADTLFEFALKYDPNNTYAILGDVLALLAERRVNEAEPLLIQLATLDPLGADIHFARALFYTQSQKEGKATDELSAANKLDPQRWSDERIPGVSELAARVSAYRYPLLLTPAALYPAKP